jgi:hypothetical protein
MVPLLLIVTDTVTPKEMIQTILHLRWPRTNTIILLDGEDGAISEWYLAGDPTHAIIAVNELQVR